ncbi:hypothetical protein [Chryseolinea lacunae]|uniref:Uncharacterized protein n=1 Tax=Chryseolinea lacunae TaxID=2801331 RepID=A0ABS1L059_9BACT|nr:hypothetical protein [Chryseolinea lacunae]MBL0744902.1 hypothetical protein [Chryseolinea lacunae]
MNITFTKIRRISGVVFEALLITCIMGCLRSTPRTGFSKTEYSLTVGALSSKTLVMHQAADSGVRIVSFSRGSISVGDVFAQSVELFNISFYRNAALFINAFQRNIFYVLITANAP